jgi:hypothetical protein
MLPLTHDGRYVVMQAVRWKNQWFRVVPRPGEPERQTADIAWLRIKGDSTPYLTWFQNERRIARLLANLATE